MLAYLKKNIEEFKTFAVKGNVIDMAVGIIIGAAFGKVVDSLVKDVIMPPLGWLLGKVDFTNMYFTIPFGVDTSAYNSLEEVQSAGIVTVNYGLFINTIISFIMVAFAVFVMIKVINKLKDAAEKKEQVEEAATTKTCPKCFSTIDIKATKCPHCTADI